MDLEIGVNDTLLDVLGETSSTTRVEGGLGAVKDGALHQLVIMQRHVPGVLCLNNFLEALAVLEHIIGVADTLAKGNNIKVIVKVVQVNIGLLQSVSTVKGNLPTLRDRADKVNHNSDVVTLGRRRVVPLEGGAKETHKIKLKVRLAVGAEGVLAAVGGLGLAVLRVFLEVLVNTGETDHLEESGAKGPTVVILVRLNGLLILRGVGAEYIVVHTVAVLDAEDEGDTGVIQEALANVGH